jgi:dTDP-L-rhamnose 4-epimerase
MVNMKSGRILVTGGAGFIGSWLIPVLIDAGASVRVLDNLSAQVHGQVPSMEYAGLNHPAVEFVRGDICCSKQLDEVLSDCDAVVHLAAETGTAQSMYQIDHYYKVNLQATAALLEAVASRHRNITKIILASSRSVYGEGAYEIDGQLTNPAPRTIKQMEAGQWDPVHVDGRALRLIATPESVPLRPASIYAATKAAMEQLGMIFADAYNTSVIALRFQNVYGERQSLRNPYTGILSIFSNRMRQQLPISIFEDGHESRDFVHASDVARAIRAAIETPMPGFHAVNIGSGRPTSVLEVAERLRSLLGSESKIAVSGEFRSGDIRHCFADLAKAAELLGYAPTVSIEEGFSRFATWVVTQPLVPDRSRDAQAELTTRGLGRVSH